MLLSVFSEELMTMATISDFAITLGLIIQCSRALMRTDEQFQITVLQGFRRVVVRN